MTPPGSPCSIHFGKGITAATPGSVQRICISWSRTSRRHAPSSSARGADVSEVFHFDARSADLPCRVRDPKQSLLRHICDVQRSGRQQLAAPGGHDTASRSGTQQPGRRHLTELLREAEEHHGEYEASAPKHHWSDWYAAYIVAREQGKTPEEAVKVGAQHMEAIRR